MNEENKIGYYAIIPSTVLFNHELKANEKLLYAVITVLSNKEGYCYASNNYLADLFNSKPHTISNWVSHLNKLKFIHVELIRDEKNEIIQRRIYINDIPYAIKMTYPYVTKKTEGMLQKRQYNNINNKIDRFFYYIIRRKGENPERFSPNEDIEFKKILEKIEFNYTEELIKIFTKDNVEKLKIIIYALKELFLSSKRKLIQKATREELLFVYDNCKDKQIEYQETEKEINRIALVSSIVISLLGITTGIIILKRKRS